MRRESNIQNENFDKMLLFFKSMSMLYDQKHLLFFFLLLIQDVNDNVCGCVVYIFLHFEFCETVLHVNENNSRNSIALSDLSLKRHVYFILKQNR